MIVKTRTTCLMILLLFVIALVPAHIYATEDEPASWAVRQVEMLKQLDFGFSEIYSDYKRNITREEFAMLVCCLYENITGTNAECGDLNAFNDITDSPYRSEILKAGTLGIVNGIGRGRFDPLGEIDRQQMAVMLFRTIKAIYPDAELSIDAELLFYDDKDIAEWARPSVTYIYDNHIMKGTSELTVEPLGKATREQALVLVFKTGFLAGLLDDRAVIGSEEYLIAEDDDGIIEELASANAEDYWETGRRYSLEQYMPNRAIAAFNKAIELDPGYYKAYRDKAEAYYFKSMYKEAMSSIQQAIELNDEDGWSYFQKGRLHYADGETDKAIDDFSRALELLEDEASNIQDIAQVYANRAVCYIHKLLFKDAVSDFRSAASLDLSYEEILTLLDIGV